MKALLAAILCFFMVLPGFASLLCGSGTKSAKSGHSAHQAAPEKKMPPCHRSQPPAAGPKFEKADEAACPLCRSGVCENQSLFPAFLNSLVQKELSHFFVQAQSHWNHYAALALANLNRGPPEIGKSFFPRLYSTIAGWQSLFSVFLL